MAQSRKRRLSMSPTRSLQPEDSPEKKRKLNSSELVAPMLAAEPIAANRPATRSPELSTSDSSATLQEDIPPTSKDKGKAKEEDPVILELERLRKEVVHKDALLNAENKTMDTLNRGLCCNICLEYMYKPYALVPCGHAACYSCLVLWFTSSHNDRDGQEHNPDREWHEADRASDAGSSDSEPPRFDDDPPQPDGQTGDDTDPMHGYRFVDCVDRQKTCPACRRLVFERPVYLWVIRSLVDIATNEVTDVSKTNDNRDPWRGIFQPAPPPPPPGPGGGGPGGGPSGGGGGGHAGGHNDDDDGARSDEDVDGPSGSANAGRANQAPNGAAGPPRAPNYPQINPSHNNDEDAVHRRAYPRHAAQPRAHPRDAIQPSADPREVHIDHEDNVRRCGECLHEIWRGVCTNAQCGVVYGDASPASSSSEAEAGPSGHFHDDDEELEVLWGPEHDGADADDDYESSFIDDEEHRSRSHRASTFQLTGDVEEPSDNDDDDFILGPSRRLIGSNDNDDFIPGPSRRLIGSNDDDDLIPRPSRRFIVSQDTIVISSDEDDQPGPSRAVRRGRRRRRRVVDDDEELQVEEDVGSVGSGSHPQHVDEGITGSGAALSVSPSVTPVIEDNDYAENYADVPYVWEQDDDGEDSDGGHDGHEEDDYEGGTEGEQD